MGQASHPPEAPLLTCITTVLKGAVPRSKPHHADKPLNPPFHVLPSLESHTCVWQCLGDDLPGSLAPPASN